MRPDTRQYAQQGRFTRARSTSHKRRFTSRETKRLYLQEGRATWFRQIKSQRADGVPSTTLDNLQRRAGACRAGDAPLETVESLDDGLPLGKLRIRLDEERKGPLNPPEGRRCLHQAAQADRARKIDWARGQDRHYDLHLVVSRREEGQPLLAVHDRGPVFSDLGEVSHQPSALG